MTIETPLIYTSMGNLPIDSLEYKTSWSDDADNTTFTEMYLLNGEVVKRSVHVMAKKGVLADGIASGIV